MQIDREWLKGTVCTDLVSSIENKDIGSRSLNMTFKIWNSPPIFMNNIVLIFFGPIYMRNLASALFLVVTHPRALLKVLTILVDLLLIFHQRAANSNFLTRLRYSRFWANISITIWRNEICKATWGRAIKNRTQFY